MQCAGRVAVPHRQGSAAITHLSRRPPRTPLALHPRRRHPSRQLQHCPRPNGGFTVCGIQAASRLPTQGRSLPQRPPHQCQRSQRSSSRLLHPPRGRRQRRRPHLRRRLLPVATAYNKQTASPASTLAPTSTTMAASAASTSLSSPPTTTAAAPSPALPLQQQGIQQQIRRRGQPDLLPGKPDSAGRRHRHLRHASDSRYATSQQRRTLCGLRPGCTATRQRRRQPCRQHRGRPRHTEHRTCQHR